MGPINIDRKMIKFNKYNHMLNNSQTAKAKDHNNICKMLGNIYS